MPDDQPLDSIEDVYAWLGWLAADARAAQNAPRAARCAEAVQVIHHALVQDKTALKFAEHRIRELEGDH